MAKSKYGKYIITDISKFKVESPAPPDPSTTGQFLGLNDDVVKGMGFFVRCFWIKSTPSKTRRLGSHDHDYDEVVAFLGSNTEDPHDLCGEIEFWIEDEQFILTKSCLIFIPKGVKHAPLQFRRVDRPIFHFTMGTSGKYGDRKATMTA